MKNLISRSRFLALSGIIALGVGGVAFLSPEAILVSKGITAGAAASVWVREVGVALMAFGFIGWRLRDEPDSPALRSVLWGNALLQWLLLPIEIWAWVAGVIPNLVGILPNSILHIILGAGFAIFARKTIRQVPARR